jgi:hypothetical protein
MSPLPLAGIPVTSVVLSLVQLNIVPGTFPDELIVTIVASEQLVCSGGEATASGIGLTVIVNAFDTPLQVAPLLVTGVTVIVAVWAVVPLLMAVNEAMSPVPLAARPIEVLSLVQVYDVPVPEKFIAVVGELLQMVWLLIEFTVGVGLTVIVNIVGAPLHVTTLFVTGVTVIVAVWTVVPLLMAVKDAILPVPLAASPIEVLLFVQEYRVPDTAPEKFIAVVDELLQTVWLLTESTVGVGLTVTVAHTGGLLTHPEAVVATTQ